MSLAMNSAEFIQKLKQVDRFLLNIFVVNFLDVISQISKGPIIKIIFFCCSLWSVFQVFVDRSRV